MNVSDDELRAMVREAIARQASADAPKQPAPPTTPWGHASHGLLTLIGGGDSEGQCLIEPAVRCNHCNFCQSLGH
jgi:hypothetical protein